MLFFSLETKGFNFSGMIEDLENAPEGAVIILHACAHNPTGIIIFLSGVYAIKYPHKKQDFYLLILMRVSESNAKKEIPFLLCKLI